MKRIDDYLISKTPASFVAPTGLPEQGEDGTWEIRVHQQSALVLVKRILTEHYGLEIVREVENAPKVEGEAPMDDDITKRALTIAEMEDHTINPGAIKVLGKLFAKYGVGDISKIEQLKLTYIQVWARYKTAGYDISIMHQQLYS
ncbi:MAG: hypothetical protein AAB557_02585 [Patescibacteria group bacterium]